MADHTQKNKTTNSDESRSVTFKIDEQLQQLNLENGNEDSDDTASEALKRRQPRGLQRNRRTKSLYGVSPNCKFGPKGCILESREGCVLYAMSYNSPGSEAHDLWYSISTA